MGLIKFENFDSPTPPAMPVGWNVNAIAGNTAVVTTTSGVTPISSPNVITVQPAVHPGVMTATWGSQDGNSGNVQVSAWCQFVTGLGNAAISVFARCSAATASYAASSLYDFCLSGVDGAFEVNRYNAGTPTSLLSIPTSALTTGTWYQITAQLVGSNPTTWRTFVIRGDGQYFSMVTGNFAVGQSFATGSDSSPITGQGYAGWGGNTGAVTPVYGDDFSLSTYAVDSPNPYGKPPVSRVADETEPFPGKAFALSSRNIPPTPQFALPHRCVVQGFELAPDPGRVIIGGQRTLSVAQIAYRKPPLPVRGVEIAPEEGRYRTANAYTQPLPQARPARPVMVRPESPPDPGSVQARGAFPAAARTDLQRPQRIAQRGELTPEGGMVITTHAQGQVNLPMGAPKIVVLRETYPEGGSVIFDVGQPGSIAPTTVPPRPFVAKPIELPPEPGRVFATDGPGISVPFTKPPGPLVVRQSDAPIDTGQTMARHAAAVVVPIMPQRATVVSALELAPEAGRWTTRHATPATYPTATRAIVVMPEFTPEPGRAFIDINPASWAIARNKVVVAAAEPIIHPGSAVTSHGKPVSSPAPFARPALGVRAMREELPPDPGRAFSWHAGPPPFNESFAGVDPDLATLVIVASGRLTVDPDAATEVIAGAD